MLPLLNKRIVAYLAILVFVIAKLPHLQAAFYWDESWVYAPAIFLMYAHGPSLLPNSIPAEYSRGHPLLYQAACALWMDIFGKSNFSMHCFALAVSVILAITVYVTIRKLFGPRAALIAVVLLLFNVPFYAQSSFLLTDIALGLFALLAIFSYSRDRFVITAIALTLGMYTKESGLVVCGVLGLDALLGAVGRRASAKTKVFRILSVFVPLIALAGFFLLQKTELGYYLFPGHLAIINTGFSYTCAHIFQSFTHLLIYEHGFLNFAVLLVLTIAAVLAVKKAGYLWLPAMLCAVYACIIFLSYKDLLFYVLLLSIIAMVIWLLKHPIKQYDAVQQKFVRLSAAFCAAFIYFSSINFYEERYLFPVALMASVVLLSIAIDHFLLLLPKNLFLLVLGALVGSGMYAMIHKGVEMDAYRRMALQQEMTAYFENNRLYNSAICCPQFFNRIHLQDPKTGFLKTGVAFPHITDHLEPRSAYVVLDNIDPPDALLDKIKRDSAFTLVAHFYATPDSIDIYKRIAPIDQ